MTVRSIKPLTPEEEACSKQGQQEMLEKVIAARKKIAEEYPLEGDYEGDARHNYPDRCRALSSVLDKLKTEVDNE